MAVLIAKDAVTVGIGLRGPERADVPAPSNFVEIRWPFPRDMWGDGRAFRCAAADCGAEDLLEIIMRRYERASTHTSVSERVSLATLPEGQ